MYLGESCAWVSVQGTLTACVPYVALAGQLSAFLQQSLGFRQKEAVLLLWVCLSTL